MWFWELRIDSIGTTPIIITTLSSLDCTCSAHNQTFRLIVRELWSCKEFKTDTLQSNVMSQSSDLKPIVSSFFDVLLLWLLSDKKQHIIIRNFVATWVRSIMSCRNFLTKTEYLPQAYTISPSAELGQGKKADSIVTILLSVQHLQL